LSVVTKLLLPEIDVGFRHGSFFAARMVMPETTVYEYCPTTRFIREIGTSWKLFDVLAVANSQLPQTARYDCLDLRALLPNM
jgi:hypothetical protein